ncbi:hypothetical protein ACQKM9_12350 [Viridibacillus sp. NPDC093762]|uniref:hypothetical protein n=1 Tax=Viridibacillus sp. NPDC093762 TaxID=3390720 RepID=UPI003D04A7D2
MQKKWILFIAAIIAVTIFIFITKWNYPPLPIDSISSKEAIQKLNESDQEIVELSKDNNINWYIMKNSADVDKKIKQFIGTNGWEFKEKDGNSLFFDKNRQCLIVNTEMWTKKYVLIRVPSTFSKK